MRFSFTKAKEFAQIKIIRYEESIYYANVDNFKYRIIKLVGIDPARETALMKKEMARDEKEAKKASLATSESCFKTLINKIKRKPIADIEHLNINNNFSSIANQKEEIDASKYLPNFAIKHVIIDCSCVNFIDSQGVNGIFQVRQLNFF